MIHTIQKQFHRAHEIAVVVYVCKFFSEMAFGVKFI